MADKSFRNKVTKNKRAVLAQVAEAMAAAAPKKGEYTEAIGRRKTAIARVRLFAGGKNEISINAKPLTEFFTTDEQRLIAGQALEIEELTDKFTVTVLVKGSGPNAQAEATRLGIARALVEIDENLRGPLKKLGYLKRDPRSVERKKPGLLKARKAPTWVKR